MTNRPSHSRTNSSSNEYRPAQPSALRQSLTAQSPIADDEDRTRSTTDLPSDPPISPNPVRPPAGGIFPNESTPLLPSQRRGSVHPAHPGFCNHGSFSPRPTSPATTMRSLDDDGSETAGSGTHIPVLDDAITTIVGHEDWKRWLKKRMRTKKMGHSSRLAEQAGVEDTALMCVYRSRFLEMAEVD